MPVNRIIYGDEGANEFYGFDDMQGDLQPKQPQLEILARPGRDGERLRDTGTRAVPSRITTLLWVDDRADHLDLLDDYIALIDGDPYEIKQHGESYGYFRIVGVSPRQPIACLNVTGHVGGGTPQIMQIIDWVVISTDAPEA